jgi:hypothetical protein
VLVEHWHTDGLANQHGDGDLRLVATSSVNSARGRGALAQDFAQLTRQLPESLGAETSGILVLQVLNFDGFHQCVPLGTVILL